MKSLLFTVLILIQVQANAAGTDTRFRFCYEDKPLPPFFMGSGYQVPDRRPGIIIELMRLLQQQMPNLKIQFARAPWSRCIQRLKHGDYDGVISNFSAARMTLGVFPMKDKQPDLSRAISQTSYCLYYDQHKKLNWDGQQFISTSNLPLAVPKGYSITALLEQRKQSYQEVQSSQQAFKLLLHGRVSAVSTLCEVGDTLLNQQQGKFQDIQRNHPVLESKYAYLLVSKSFFANYPQLVQQMWEILPRIQQEQRHKLLHHYAHHEENTSG